MAKIEHYRLARPDMQIPMPDRAGRLFTTADDGEAIDVEDRFWATLVADGDLVKVQPAEPVAGSKKGKTP